MLIITDISFSTPVSRQNYGVIFQPIRGKLINGHHSTQLILAVPYDIGQAVSPLNVSTFISSTYFSPGQREVFLTMTDKIAMLDTEITDTYSKLTSILSNPIQSTNTDRQKRAILPFVGDFFKFLIGTATENDYQALKQYVMRVDRYISAVSKQNIIRDQIIDKVVKTQADFISTYSSERNDFMDALQNISNTLETQINTLSSAISGLSLDLGRFDRESSLFRAVITSFSERSVYLAKLKEFLSNINDLSRGILTPNMVAPKTLENALQQHELRMVDLHATARLVIKNTGFYYVRPLSSFTYSKTHLYIGIEVFTTAYEATFRLYNVRVYHVPLNSSGSDRHGVTILNTKTEILAIGENNMSFMELSSNSIANRWSGGYFIINNELPRTHIDSPSCLLTIFQGNEPSMDLCRFSLKPNILVPEFSFAINKYTYIITSSQPSYSLICIHSIPISHPLQAHQILSIPCGCQISINNGILSNSNLNCKNRRLKPLLLSPINFPVVKILKLKFSQKHDYVHYGPFTLSHPLLTDLKAKFHNDTRHLLSQSLDLKNMADNLLNTDTIYDGTPFPDTSAGSFFLSLPFQIYVGSLSTLCGLGMIYLFCKIYRPATFMALPMAAAAFKIPLNSSSPFSSPTIMHAPFEPPVLSSLLKPSIASENKTVFLIFTILLFYFLTKLALKLYKSLKGKCKVDCPEPTFPILHLNFVSRTSILPLHMLTIYEGANLCVFHNSPEPISLQFPFPFTTLHVSWASRLSFFIKDDLSSLRLPTRIPVPLVRKFAVRKIMSSYDKTMVTMTSGGTVHLPYEKKAPRPRWTSDEVHGEIL